MYLTILKKWSHSSHVWVLYLSNCFPKVTLSNLTTMFTCSSFVCISPQGKWCFSSLHSTSVFVWNKPKTTAFNDLTSVWNTHISLVWTLSNGRKLNTFTWGWFLRRLVLECDCKGSRQLLHWWCLTGGWERERASCLRLEWQWALRFGKKFVTEREGIVFISPGFLDPSDYPAIS